MAVSSFDTITATRSLERSGVPRAQAESITNTVRQAADAWTANLATKDDLAVLRADMKADLAALKAEVFRALWVLGIGMLTGVGVLLAISRMV